MKTCFASCISKVSGDGQVKMELKAYFVMAIKREEVYN